MGGYFMSKTLFVNLFGAPGAGKSTTMADVFAELKWEGYDVEMLSEFAKDLVWERRHETFKDQTYIFGKQHHKFARVDDKVDIAICDSPLLLSVVYNRVNGNEHKPFNATVLEHINRYNNLNFFLNRTKKYNPNGRNQTEEESDRLAYNIKDTLREFGFEFIELDATKDNVPVIAEIIKKKFKELRELEELKVEQPKVSLMYKGRMEFKTLSPTDTDIKFIAYPIGSPFLLENVHTLYSLLEFKQAILKGDITPNNSTVFGVYVNGYETNLAIGGMSTCVTENPVNISLYEADKFLGDFNIVINWDYKQNGGN